MIFVRRRALAALLSIASMCAAAGASACECQVPPSAREMRSAKEVVVVRVRSTGVPHDPDARFGIARVEVLDHLKGDASPITLRYSLGLCCPLRIEAGRDYIVMFDEASDRIDVGLGNLVIISTRWSESYSVSGSGRVWRDILSGRRDMDADFFEIQMRWLFGGPSPPPPPPKQTHRRPRRAHRE